MHRLRRNHVCARGALRSRLTGRTVLPVLMFGAGLSFLLVAWLASNPLGAAPDEQAQYVHAAALSQGEVFGSVVAIPRTPGETYVMWRFQEQITRAFELPRRLAPPPFAACFQFHPDTSAACTVGLRQPKAGRFASYVALYPPTLYALPALLIRVASNPFEALFLGRIGVVIATAPLLLLAVRLSWTGRVVSLLGPALAITPMVVFVAATLSDSSLEVTGGITFAAALLRMRRAPTGPSHLTSVGLAAGGFALVATRPTGPLWVGVDLAIFAVLVTWRDLASWWRDSPWGIGAPAGIVIGGAAYNLLWTAAGHAGSLVHLGNLVPAVNLASAQAVAYTLEEVGVFGWLDTNMPGAVYWFWIAVIGAVAILAVARGTYREGIGVIVAAGLVAATTIGLAAVLIASSNFVGQGRYFLPVAVFIPLLACDVLGANTSDIWWPGLALTAFAGWAIAIVQALAWWENARRYAVGRGGPIGFLFHGALWSPGGGWLPWACLAALGCSAMGAAFCLAFHAEHRIMTGAGLRGAR